MLRFITTAATFSFIISCSNQSSHELAVYKIADEGLFQSIRSLSSNNNNIYYALERQLSKPSTAEQAKVWQPKAMLIKEKSDALFNYLETIIIGIKEKAGLKIVNSAEVFDEQNNKAVEAIISDNNSGENIFLKFHQYKKNVLAIDPELNFHFGKNETTGGNSPQDDSDKIGVSEQNLFKSANVIAAIVILRKIQNEIRNLEGNMISFCLSKTPSYDGCGYTIYRPIVGQSSSIVKKGDKIKIQTGIGAFSASPNPIFFIDRKILKPKDGDGYIEYDFKAPNKSGNYSKELTIEFTKEDGVKQKQSYTIEYTVKE